MHDYNWTYQLAEKKKSIIFPLRQRSAKMLEVRKFGNPRGRPVPKVCDVIYGQDNP